MITDLWIENFKGIGKRQHIPLRPITLLFGANSAGKSTVLHALLYLREILVNHEFEPKLPLDGDNTVSLGPFNEFLHDDIEFRDLPQKHKLTIGLRFQPSETSINKYVQRIDPERRAKPGADFEVDPEVEHVGSFRFGRHLHQAIDVQFSIGPSALDGRFLMRNAAEFDHRRQLKQLTISIAGSKFIDLELDPASDDSDEILGYANLLSLAWSRQLPSDGNHQEMRSRLRSESDDAWCIEKDSWHDRSDSVLLVLAPLETVERRWIELSQLDELIQEANELSQYTTVVLSKYLRRICRKESVDALEIVLSKLGINADVTCRAIVSIMDDQEDLSSESNGIDPHELVGILFADPVDRTRISEVLDVVRTLSVLRMVDVRPEQTFWARRFSVADHRLLLPSDDPALAVRFARDPLAATPQADSTMRIKPEDTVSQIVKGSLFCLAEELRELIYVGPKRSTVPRTFSSDHFPGCTNWGAGLAAWKWLLDADDADVQRCNDWLGPSGKGLGTGFKIEVERFREIRESNPDWPSVDALEPLSVEPRPEPDTELLVLIKKQYEKVREAYLEAHRFKRLHLQDIARSTNRHPQDLGEGITQVVPVIVSCVKAEKSEGFVAIEQPELHLHPSLAAKLGDLFMSTMFTQHGARALIETHSEHLILRILRRIRQTTDGELPEHIPPVKPDDVCVLWVDNLGDGTTFTRLRISDNGRWLDRWPDGFFSERHEELFE